MITRGHFIGEIVDELSSVAHQIATRSKLGLLDLNLYSENFFRDVLNALYDWQLVNLNENRSNEPGLDLGDKFNKIAIQVTSRSDAAKVNATLQRITENQARDYGKIFVFVTGYKQGSYTLDTMLCKTYSFAPANILDVTDLCHKVMGLPIDKLRTLHQLVRDNVARVLNDLETPDPETGVFPTSGFDKWEPRADPKIGDAKQFVKWYSKKLNVSLDPEDITAIQKDLVMLGQRLRRLPRVTREFLAVLFEHKSPHASKRFNGRWKSVRCAIVERVYVGGLKSLRAELELLMEENFVEIGDDDPNECGEPEIGMCIPADSDELAFSFLAYVKAKRLDLRKILGQVDLSEF